ncbi:MAG: hypothetical protein M1838_001235 [Thelocarpon superellum]|nr:MAG: hypothetical protein M1838_001235 [Thelocarpon superellum]
MLFFYLALSLLVAATHAGYSLVDTYEASNFFSEFDFFTGPDPTNGFVQYVDQATAESTGLASTNDSLVYMGVDHSTVSSSGRASVRVTSQKSYTHGLVVADISHMPGGECGTWPAFWTVGPNWPNDGEIDIIEGVNSANTNQMTLHSNDGCSMTGGSETGNRISTNCYAYAAGNQGCGVVDSDTQSYGTGFNDQKGGVYAMEWTSQAINIYFFSRMSVPPNVLSQNPDPTTWGTPVASYQDGCNIDANFQSHQIVFDTTFCGDWAGNTWSSSSCASSAASCTDFVANNPSAFTEAYWEILSLQVFQTS